MQVWSKIPEMLENLPKSVLSYSFVQDTISWKQDILGTIFWNQEIYPENLHPWLRIVDILWKSCVEK